MTLPPPDPAGRTDHVLVDLEEGSADDAFDPNDGDVDWSHIEGLTDAIQKTDFDEELSVLRLYDRLAG